MTAAGVSLYPGTPDAVPRLLAGPAPAEPRSFVDIRRPPDSIRVETDDRSFGLPRKGDRWEQAGVALTLQVVPGALRVLLTADGSAVKRLRLRWRGEFRGALRVLGDAWERSYGDLEWRGMAPDRVMPWYMAVWDGMRTDVYGVRTGCNAFCFWRLDPDGVSLWADVRSGGVGVRLDDRSVAVCDLTCREGAPEDSPWAALHAFCRKLCPEPRLPSYPVYGSNDWYWAYGNNSAESVRTDAAHIVDLSPGGGVRPFVVIDDGWQPERGADGKSEVGLWDRGNEKFPDLPGLAGQVRSLGARPGIWVRPLLAPKDAPQSWRLARDRTVLDPTVPAVGEKVMGDLTRLTRWGFELIKHDYTTYDLFGRWGFQMGSSPTRDGWTFQEGPHRTSAEVLNAMYQTIRRSAGDALVIGCNTVSHLSAGRFEICRIGDDTSGTEWGRVPKMGVNTLAFRGPQHGAFYVADPDCVGVTNAISWDRNRQWLDLLSRSGTMLFVSLAPDALDAGRRRDLRAALARAARTRPLGAPLDWQDTTWPARWRLGGEERSYDWVGEGGLDRP